jgi:cobalt-zinc-cadmium efflux system outer membrane protein
MTDLKQASRRISSTLVTALGLSLSLTIPQAFSASNSYLNLLETVSQQQPEQLTAAGLQSLQTANQSLANSWLAGDVSLKVHHENDAMTGNEEIQNWAVGAEFPVWYPSQLQALEGLSSSYQQQVSSQSAYLTWLASSTLRSLAWTYKKATIELGLAQSTLQQSVSLQEKVQKKLTAGESSQLDLLLSKKAVLKQQALVSQKQGQVKLAKSQFKIWTQSEKLPADISESQLKAKPLDEHPQMRWLQSFYQVSEAQLIQQKSLKQAGPTFYLGTQNDKDRVMDNTSLVLSVSIPLGLNPSNAVAVASQQQEMLSQQAKLARAKLELMQAISAAEQAIDTNQQQSLLVKQQSALDQKALRLAEKSYQYGASTLQDLLRIQQQASASQLNLELTYANLGQSIANYNQVVGYSLTDPLATPLTTTLTIPVEGQ